MKLNYSRMSRKEILRRFGDVVRRIRQDQKRKWTMEEIDAEIAAARREARESEVARRR